MQLRTPAPSWVEVTDARGRALLSRLVQPGEALGLDGAAPFRVRDRQRRGNRSSAFAASRWTCAVDARQRRPPRAEVGALTHPTDAPMSLALDAFIEPAQPAPRRSRQASVRWGARVVTIGGDAPVRVQAMTNTDTVDAIGTAIQVKELARRRLGDGAHHRQHARGRGRRAATSASSSTAWASTCR